MVVLPDKVSQGRRGQGGVNIPLDDLDLGPHGWPSVLWSFTLSGQDEI